MKKQRLLCLCLAVLFTALTSCSAINTETKDIIAAPGPTGEYAKIAKAFSKTVSDDYSLVYPSAGDNTSAYIIRDMDSDGQNEALVLYTLKHESRFLHISLMGNDRGRWYRIYDYVTDGTGVYKLIFSDFSGFGKLGIVLGITDSIDKSSRLEVISYDGLTLTRQMQGSYIGFAVADMDEDGGDELVLLRDHYDGNIAVQRMAVMCRFDAAGRLIEDEVYSSPIDQKATSYYEPVVGRIEYSRDSFGGEAYPANALYFDAVKSEGLITEVVYFDRQSNMLVTPMYDTDSEANTSTVRGAGKRVKDINGDGGIDIPHDTVMPGPVYSERVYTTRWMSLYRGNSLIDVLATYIDKDYSFMLTLPEQWAQSDSITVMRSNNLVVFGLWDSDKNYVVKNLAEIRIVDEGKYAESNSADSGYIRLGTKYGSVYTAKVLETDNKYSITEEQIINGFVFR